MLNRRYLIIFVIQKSQFSMTKLGNVHVDNYKKAH